jgi:hypothetical protein
MMGKLRVLRVMRAEQYQKVWEQKSSVPLLRTQLGIALELAHWISRLIKQECEATCLQHMTWA